MLGQDLSDIDLRDVGLVLFYYLIKLNLLVSIVIYTLLKAPLNIPFILSIPLAVVWEFIIAVVSTTTLLTLCINY